MNEKIEIEDIVNDDSNFNKGTDEGNRLLNQSINEHGFGRSILIDKNNRIISGNKSFDVAKETLQKIRVIESTGNQLIAVKRIDIDLDSKEGREMALADNSVSLTNLNWDKDMISSVTSEFKINKEEWGVKKDAEWVDGVTTENYKPMLICPSCFTEFMIKDEEEDN